MCIRDSISPADLVALDELVTPLILQGQSPYMILRNHPEIALSEKTLYNYITGLLERIDKGASSKFIIERQKSETDFFELDQKGDKVIIRGMITCSLLKCC